MRQHAARNPRRPEKDDRILDVVGSEPAQRIQVLRKDAERTRVRAMKKLNVFVRERMVDGHQKTVSSSTGPEADGSGEFWAQVKE